MISIVIPLYNKEKQIVNTLNSVFNQTFQDFEVVIVNDGSTDKSVDIVKSLEDPRIRLIEQQNQGVSVARNKGIREAKYDYIALLDADDEWKPNYLEAQVDLIKSFPECSVYATKYEMKHADVVKPIILNKIPFEGEKGVLSNYFEIASCSTPPLWTSAVVVKKEAILSIGAFPEGVIEGEDLITWAKLAIKYKIAYSNKISVYFVNEASTNYSTKLPRIQKEKHDLGKELKFLLDNNKNIAGLKRYVSLWYKMRASMFLLVGDKKNSLKESLNSLKFNPLNIKVWIYIFLLPFPNNFSLLIFRKFGNQ
ncbi:glycosyltransferase involved in cell wall biosynthesis [Dysgonomonadaceae bacterium PH5-43]|nr:glycosyltransferase involved in cell wall biosynthesis [Dysgonomonadaceae bacterium PH5-43]